MKRVLVAVLVALTCFAAHAETDYTVERKVDYLWRHVMGSGGGGDYPTKEWVNGKLAEERQSRVSGDAALETSVTAVSNRVTALENASGGYVTEDDVYDIVNEMASDGWEVDGTRYKLVVQVVPPPSAETTFTLDDGTEEVWDISGVLDRQWMVDNGYYDADELAWLKTIVRVNVGTNVTDIGDRAFSTCDRLVDVTIPGSVTNIGAYAFRNGFALANVTLGSGVVRLGKSAFGSCIALTSVTLPDSVTDIGQGAFAGCNRLMDIVVGPGNPSYSSLDGVLFSEDRATLVCVPAGRSGAYDIPDGVTIIGAEAFCGCSSLSGVTIPTSVQRIKEDAFWGCGGLTSVTIPSGVTYIGGGYVFYGCSALTNISVAAENTHFSSANGLLLSKSGETLFHGVNGEVTIPDGVTDIAWGAFFGRFNLTGVTIPDSVTSIGGAAFCNDINLESVTIGDGVTSIGSDSFESCYGLTTVDMSGKTAAAVQAMSNRYWGLRPGCVITCSDDTITVP